MRHLRVPFCETALKGMHDDGEAVAPDLRSAAASLLVETVAAEPGSASTFSTEDRLTTIQLTWGFHGAIIKDGFRVGYVVTNRRRDGWCETRRRKSCSRDRESTALVAFGVAHSTDNWKLWLKRSHLLMD